MPTINCTDETKFHEGTETEQEPPLDNRLRRLILLGPQPEFETLRLGLDRIAAKQPAALITAGWQEDEAADGDVQAVLPPSSINLRLFQRSEELFEHDAELIELLKQRQDELRALRDAYRMRLDCSLDAARKMVAMQAREPFDFRPEFESAVEMLRQLDRQYLLRTTQILDGYDQALDIENRPEIRKHREQLQQILDGSGCLVIAGGHVAIILNRLRLFGVLEMNPQLPIVAWSAGTMALSDQIVLFHDHPPQGKGNPEVLRPGIGLFHEILPLPDAQQRLDLADELRVILLSRRFIPYVCIGLNQHSLLDRHHGHWQHHRCQRLKVDGTVEELSS